MSKAGHFRRIWATIVAVVLFVPALAHAKEPVGKVLTYGIFKTTEKQLTDTPNTPSGKTRIVDNKLVVTTVTNRIPARIGMTFGIAYRLFNLPIKDGDSVDVTDITLCPRIKRPDGTVCERFVEHKKLRVLNGEAGAFSGYTFDLPYETVPGVWKTEIQVNGKTVVAQEFTIFKE